MLLRFDLIFFDLLMGEPKTFHSDDFGILRRVQIPQINYYLFETNSGLQGPKTGPIGEKCGKRISSFFVVFLAHFYCQFIEIIGLKGRGNYSASIGYNNFSICLWESPKLFISMIAGFLDVSRSTKTNYHSFETNSGLQGPETGSIGEKIGKRIKRFFLFVGLFYGKFTEIIGLKALGNYSRFGILIFRFAYGRAQNFSLR